MQVKKHVNSATIQVDFQSLESIRDALDFILYFGNIFQSEIDVRSLAFDKIRLIKLVRQFGHECVDRHNDGQRGAGLALAKKFVDNEMMEYVVDKK